MYFIFRSLKVEINGLVSSCILKVEAERAYHQRVLQILDQLEGEVAITYQFCSEAFRLMLKDY